MKKKFKLFASLASLCLSLGILCFGVYAATSVNYTATGSVSYTVSDVFVNVSSKLYRSTTNTVSTTTQVDEVVTALKADPSTATGVEETGYTGDTVETLVDGSVVSPGQEVTGEAKDIAIKYGSYTAEGDTAYAYYLVVEIENLGNETIKAEVTNNIADASALNSYIPAVDNTNIAADQTVRLVIAFALVDPTVGVTENGDFEFDIVISQGEIGTSILSENKQDGYYYITMGEYQDTPVEWRLLSTDGGQTRYNYVAGQANSITGNCLFVQNTYTKSMKYNNAEYVDEWVRDEPAGSGGNFYMTIFDDYYQIDDVYEDVEQRFITMGESESEGYDYVEPSIYNYSIFRAYLNSDVITDLGLEDNEIYNQITPHAQYNDKLMLLTEAQAENLFANETDRIFDAKNYLITEQDLSGFAYASLINAQGIIDNSISESELVENEYAIRACFTLAI